MIQFQKIHTVTCSPTLFTGNKWPVRIVLHPWKDTWKPLSCLVSYSYSHLLQNSSKLCQAIDLMIIIRKPTTTTKKKKTTKQTHNFVLIRCGHWQLSLPMHFSFLLGSLAYSSSSLENSFHFRAFAQYHSLAFHLCATGVLNACKIFSDSLAVISSQLQVFSEPVLPVCDAQEWLQWLIPLTFLSWYEGLYPACLPQSVDAVHAQKACLNQRDY